MNVQVFFFAIFFLSPVGLKAGSNMTTLLSDLTTAANPWTNYYLSGKRAELLLSTKPEFSDSISKFHWYKNYYSELLNSGQSEKAASGFQSLLDDPTIVEVLSREQLNEVMQLTAVSHLRTGENQNCVAQHNSQSCIFPIMGEGCHQSREGSELALKMYKDILTVTPDDFNSRWLANVAAMTLGQYPDGVDKSYLIPPESLGLNNKSAPMVNIASQLGMAVDGLAGGSIMEDFNNDGLLDIFCTSYALTDSCKLFINNGDGSFTDSSEKAGLEGLVGGLNAKQADFDNDGDVDILVLRGAWLDKGGEWPNSLLRNNGDGTFTDVTFAAGMVNNRPTETAAWGDINGDKLLDVYIANENNPNNDYPCELWLNNGDGTFTDIAKELGVAGNFGYVKGVNLADFNNDGRPDIFLSVLGDPSKEKQGNNKLFMGRASDNKYGIAFEDISEQAGITEPYFSFPSAVFDYDNDGWEDIFVCGFDMNRLDRCGEDAYREYTSKEAIAETPRLFRNNGDETFTDVTEVTGLDKVTYGMGLNFGDIDNDGWLDLYVGTGAFDFRTLVPNRLFKNIEGKKFEDMGISYGLSHLQKGHGIAFGDLDNNGTQDIYCVLGGAFEGDNAKNALFHNMLPAQNWICISVQADSVNLTAHGSKLKLTTVTPSGKKRVIFSTIGSGASFGANSLQQEIGLGSADEIERIDIQWEKPNKAPTSFFNIPANKHVKLYENGKWRTVDKPVLKLSRFGRP